MSDVTSFDPYALPPEAIEEPPVSLWAALRKIGPGIVLAGTIVGSGELIATTGLGAEAGYTYLWLILFSCIIKVFVQTELGRYAISSGKPTLGAMDELGGPRLGSNWLTWWWLFMMLSTFFQLGGMTGTIGQAMNGSFISAQSAQAAAQESKPDTKSSAAEKKEAAVDEATQAARLREKASPFSRTIAAWLGGWAPSLGKSIMQHPEYPWAVLTCLVTIALLWRGDYRRIEVVTTILVVSVTLLTVISVLALPFTAYPIPWKEAAQGLIPSMPSSGVAKAFAVFGITGVGATELFYYPYWCLEKGYARAVGKRDDSEAWHRRAKGWIRVMYLDAWVSMLVFTVSTVSFYFMGAAVLHSRGLVPGGPAMIETLSLMFADTFGSWTRPLFLVGAAAVLFKTLYLSSAGNGRLTADFLALGNFTSYRTPQERGRMIHWLSIAIPVIAVTLFFSLSEPVTMVVIGGVGQALTLPMIAAVTLYFRYKKLDSKLSPSRFMDGCLWLAFVLITLVACYGSFEKVMNAIYPPPPLAKAPAKPEELPKTALLTSLRSRTC